MEEETTASMQEPVIDERTEGSASAEGDEQAAQEKEKPECASGSMTRRTFMGGTVLACVLVGVGGLKFAGAADVVRPPGGQDEDHLNAACIRCMRCYEACPRSVIVPARFEDGFLSARTPTLDFSADYCDFCQKENGGSPLCVKNCPTGALELEDGATPTNTFIGLAVIDTYQCLAYRDTGCHICYEACPYEAIDLVGTADQPRPVVNADKCTGCGACEADCVSLSAGSIVSGVTERAITVKTFNEVV